MSQVLGKLDDYPRASLVSGPTPIEPAPRLSGELGLEVLIKRDDLTGLAFGGNKNRQLEFYFGAAREAGADTVLITGAVQSNYARTAAAAAARHGLAMHIQLEERVPHVDDTYRLSGNVLLDDLLGAVRHSYPDGEDEAGADAAIRQIADDLRARGKRPYVIPLGPDNPPLGALGYVVAAREIVAQLDAADTKVDAVVAASGSGFTHAGLLVGLRALGSQVPLYGICVRRDAARQRPRIADKCRALAPMLGIVDPVTDADILLDDDCLAPGYGRINDATMAAMLLTARSEGLFLDPPYTGKTMAGLIHLARAGDLAAGSRVLFIHTGGTPALFAYAPELRERMSTA
ncbi:MAG: D-cysteine desulfhydrase family protein [Alphaproteobacteria bacterium]|jgi:D-cysteine desulfhydrase family pyridoxal phosphate-dependent enzyme|nr:D-cysteine desulfhydrase family protein [Alphaproteobacteria bacterium]MDP6567899.1 D-cysteine desulfhydrase family protein [Alphaproteobacteria bacterium]MDP6812406.1 D-cysteine desulfhydrase family protein [Alphaproteobacteria bacterium]